MRLTGFCFTLGGYTINPVGATIGRPPFRRNFNHRRGGVSPPVFRTLHFVTRRAGLAPAAFVEIRFLQRGHMECPPTKKQNVPKRLPCVKGAGAIAPEGLFCLDFSPCWREGRPLPYGGWIFARIAGDHWSAPCGYRLRRRLSGSRLTLGTHAHLL